MLNAIAIKNFRCLRDVKVPLRPLTVLVGPNDSGKSSFLAAMNYLGESVSVTEFDYWRRKQSVGLVVRGIYGKGSSVTRGRGPDVASAGLGPKNPARPAKVFNLPSTGVPMISPGHEDQGATPPEVDSDGAKIPALFDYLLRTDRKRLDRCVDVLRDLIAGFEDIRVSTPSRDTRQIDLVIEKGLSIPGSYASVGVRLLLFFVAMAYHPAPPKLILLEEPENGVHPKRLGDVMRLLREITQGKHGNHAAQVVLTTHSPHLLDYVDLSQDQVLVFRREDDGSRTAEPADAERLKTFLDEFMLGEVWYNEGEAGLVGKDK